MEWSVQAASERPALWCEFWRCFRLSMSEGGSLAELVTGRRSKRECRREKERKEVGAADVRAERKRRGEENGGR